MAGNLKEALCQFLDADELAQLNRAFELIGDIAVIAIPPVLKKHQQRIAAALLAANRRIRVVATPTGVHAGEYRTRPLRVVAGEQRLETETREHGVRLWVDLARVYYSARSGQERRRIANLVGPGESVLVLFSGVAPYPLVIAAHARPRLVVGIEKNPDAHHCALESLRRNRRLQNVHLRQGDAAGPASSFAAGFDRVLLPLPGGAEPFLPVALAALRQTGWLHFYDMQSSGQEGESVARLTAACAAAGRKITATTVTRCGHCAPQLYRLCVDARIEG